MNGGAGALGRAAGIAGVSRTFAAMRMLSAAAVPAPLLALVLLNLPVLMPTSAEKQLPARAPVLPSVRDSGESRKMRPLWHAVCEQV